MNQYPDMGRISMDASLPTPGNWHGHTIPVQNDLVVIHEGSSDLLVLNNTAQLIWEYWREGHDLQGITNKMSELFAISEDQIASDIQHAFTEWENAGLFRSQATNILPEPCNLSYKPSFSIPLRWHSEHSYQFFDCIIHMRCATEEIANSLHPLFSHLSVMDLQTSVKFTLDVVCGASGYELQEKGAVVFSSESLDALAMGITNCVIQKAYHAGDNLIGMHAGAVAHNNHCIVMPGASGSGKSTLTAALVHAGMTYLSDEVVPLDRTTLEAVPLPLCLNIKAGSFPVLSNHLGKLDRPKGYQYGQRSVYYQQPWNYQETKPTKRYPVNCMVFPYYEKGATTSLTSLSAATALQRLMTTQSVVARPTDLADIKKLVSWIQSVPVFELKFESLHDAIDQIMNLFEKSGCNSRPA